MLTAVDFLSASYFAALQDTIARSVDFLVAHWVGSRSAIWGMRSVGRGSKYEFKANVSREKPISAGPAIVAIAGPAEDDR